MDIASVLEAGDGSVYRDMGDPEALGQLNDPCFSRFSDQIPNGLDIIFGNFRGMLLSCL
jgi:hypothetical protein